MAVVLGNISKCGILSYTQLDFISIYENTAAFIYLN